MILGQAHGAFNVVGGLWPLVSLRSFEAVFGPKADRWLEYTVAGLLLTNGCTQIYSARRGDTATSARLGIGTASTLLAIDLVFVPKGTIRWTYLIDAAMEIGLIALWKRSTPTSPEARSAPAERPSRDVRKLLAGTEQDPERVAPLGEAVEHRADREAVRSEVRVVELVPVDRHRHRRAGRRPWDCTARPASC